MTRTPLTDFTLYLILKEKMGATEIQKYFIVPGVFVQKALAKDAYDSACGGKEPTSRQKKAILNMLTEGKQFRIKKDNR